VKQMLAFKESSASLDDVLQNALELYKVKHLKQHSFFFLQYLLILKDAMN
jgi:hypothetical protein